MTNRNIKSIGATAVVWSAGDPGRRSSGSLLPTHIEIRHLHRLLPASSSSPPTSLSLSPSPLSSHLSQLIFLPHLRPPPQSLFPLAPSQATTPQFVLVSSRCRTEVWLWRPQIMTPPSRPRRPPHRRGGRIWGQGGRWRRHRGSFGRDDRGENINSLLLRCSNLLQGL